MEPRTERNKDLVQAIKDVMSYDKEEMRAIEDMLSPEMFNKIAAGIGHTKAEQAARDLLTRLSRVTEGRDYSKENMILLEHVATCALFEFAMTIALFISDDGEKLSDNPKLQSLADRHNEWQQEIYRNNR